MIRAVLDDLDAAEDAIHAAHDRLAIARDVRRLAGGRRPRPTASESRLEGFRSAALNRRLTQPEAEAQPRCEIRPRRPITRRVGCETCPTDRGRQRRLSGRDRPSRSSTCSNPRCSPIGTRGTKNSASCGLAEAIRRGLPRPLALR
jgi:hypothetical protein